MSDSVPQRMLRAWRRRGTLGARGERAAAKYLRRQGYRILARNRRTRLGEIDLVVEDSRAGHLVIVEVKSGTSEDPPPEVHLDHRKQRKLSALAAQLVNDLGLQDRLVRFDLVAVVWPESAFRPSRVTHYENAFESLG